MGEITDVLGLIHHATRLGPSALNDLSDITSLRGKSITRGAKEATFQFPCLITDSTPISMADTTRQMLDKTYAAFAQTWLSMNQMFDISIDPTPLSYLKKLHQNFSMESVEIMESEDMDRYMQQVYDGSVMLYMNESKDFGIMFNMKNEDVRTLYESNIDLLREYMSDFDLRPLDITEANSDGTSLGDFSNAVIDGMIKQANDTERHSEGRHSEKAQVVKLTNRDIKRSNEMVPYGLEVRLVAVNDKKQFVQYIDVVVGIKTILHPIRSEDMVDNIARALQNRSLMFKMLRWTTGEISLVKDILLNMNDIKADAIAKSNGRSPYFGALKRLKDKRLSIRNLTVPTNIIPNATIVLTRYETDTLKDKYAIDLYDNRTVKKLIESLFLICFIILDESSNTMQVMYDSSSDFETYSMDVLERENAYAASRNTLGKEIGRMIAH